MPDVWAIMRAVRSSDLPTPSKVIVFTLVSFADPQTAVIPDRYTPSLTKLANYTSLGRSTVAEHLNRLEDAGWIKRSAPSKQAAWRDKECTTYVLAIPPGTSPAVGLVQELDQSDSGTSPGAGLGLVQELDRTSPGAGHEVQDLEDQKKTNRSSNTSGPAKPAKKPRKDEPHRDDVEQICTHLAARIAADGSKPPTITNEWRRQARLLLDEDRTPRLTVDKVIALINWCQDSAFWRANIRSMPKFREKYDTLRLQALAEYERTRSGRSVSGSRPLSPADQRVADNEALLRKYAAQDGIDLGTKEIEQ